MKYTPLHLTFIALMAASPLCPAASCEVPEFAEALIRGATLGGPSIGVNVAGMLRIHVPAGFEGIAFSSDANVFGYADGARVVIGLETPSSVAAHEPGATPERFFRDMLTGRTEQACGYLAAFRFEQQDFRIRSLVGTMDVFAFGKGTIHEALILNPARPDIVIRMRFHGYDRGAFESALSTLTSH